MNLTLRQANESDEYRVEASAPSHDRSQKVTAARRQSKRKVVSTKASLVDKIRDTIERSDALCPVLGKLHAGAKFDEKKAEALHNEIRQLEAQIPDPPQSFMSLLARAEIARFGADRNKSREMAELTSQDVFEGPAARLIDAVIQFGERETSRK
jgi:DNA repair exonuclease SbcCD ATPase subunit